VGRGGGKGSGPHRRLICGLVGGEGWPAEGALRLCQAAARLAGRGGPPAAPAESRAVCGGRSGGGRMADGSTRETLGNNSL
jgi:hypothetical protein